MHWNIPVHLYMCTFVPWVSVYCYVHVVQSLYNQSYFWLSDVKIRLVPWAIITIFKFILHLYSKKLFTSKYKVAKNRKCTEWQTDLVEHLIAKSTLYKLNTSHPHPNPEDQVVVCDQSFSRYCIFYNSPLTKMLNVSKKKKNKKLTEIQNLKFHNSLNNFVRDPP